MKNFLRKLRWLARGKTKESELREELEFHLSEEAEGFRQEGLTDHEAKWAARRELGNVALIKEETRSAWGWTLMEQFAQDLRYALRTMSANRAFTLLAVISLGLGIGANTAIYSLMDAILVRSLPVPHPESLVVLNWHANRSRTRDFVMHGMHGSTYDDDKLGETSGMFPYPAFELF